MTVKANRTMTIATQVHVDHQRIADVLTNGIEGGTNYWAQWDNTDKGLKIPSGTKYDDYAIDGPLNNDETINGNRFAVLAMTDCGSIDVYDREEPTEKLGVLSKFNVAKALQMMANGVDIKGNEVPTLRRHFLDILNEDDDSDTGDVLIQMAVMGELVFG